MSIGMDEEIKRWTGRRKWELVMDIIQGATTVSESFRLVFRLRRSSVGLT